MFELPLVPFNLVFENVDTFGIGLIGNPWKDEDGVFWQKIQYRIRSEVNGTIAEHKNADVPIEIGGLVNKFIMETISDEEKEMVNNYLKTFNPLLELQ